MKTGPWSRPASQWSALKNESEVQLSAKKIDRYKKNKIIELIFVFHLLPVMHILKIVSTS